MTATALELLAELRARGVHLARAEGGRLAATPASLLDDRLRAVLKLTRRHVFDRQGKLLISKIVRIDVSAFKKVVKSQYPVLKDFVNQSIENSWYGSQQVALFSGKCSSWLRPWHGTGHHYADLCVLNFFREAQNALRLVVATKGLLGPRGDR